MNLTSMAVHGGPKSTAIASGISVDNHAHALPSALERPLFGPFEDDIDPEFSKILVPPVKPVLFTKNSFPEQIIRGRFPLKIDLLFIIMSLNKQLTYRKSIHLSFLLLWAV